MFQTIQEMRHFIRTVYGDSENSYKSTEELKFHGILQGNGAGPTIWALVSTPLLDRLRVKKCGVAIVLMDGTSLQIPAFAFVDDVDLIQELTNIAHIHEAQEAVDEWSDALKATGGALVPDKCKWFAVHPEWTQNKWRLNKTSNRTSKLYINGEDGDRTEISKCDNDSGQLALGIAFSPAGDTREEAKRLRAKVIDWTEHVRTGHLTRQEAWQCLHTTVLKTIDYTLPASILSKQDHEGIMGAVLQVGLSKAGICRNISRSVAYASIQYQGLGLKNPFWMQGIYKIQMLFDQTQLVTQKLIDVSWTRMIQETGLGNAFWMFSYTRMQKLVTKGWLTSLWEFLSLNNNIVISRMDGLHSRECRFQGDDFLMKRILHATDLSGDTLRLFNYCRIYLQVELISDIVTADGKSIRHGIWAGQFTDEHRQSPKTSWITQPRPTEKAWSIWRLTLQRVFGTTSDGKFACALPTLHRTKDWTWEYDIATQRLYRKLDNSTSEYSVSRGGRRRSNRRPTFLLCGQVQQTPTNAVAVSTYRVGDNIMIEGMGSGPLLSSNRFDIDISYFICTSPMEEYGRVLYEAIFTNRLLIVSDGSEKMETGPQHGFLLRRNCFALLTIFKDN